MGRGRLADVRDMGACQVAAEQRGHRTCSAHPGKWLLGFGRGRGTERCAFQRRGAGHGQLAESMRGLVSRPGLGDGDGRRFWWRRRGRGVWDQAMAV